MSLRRVVALLAVASGISAGSPARAESARAPAVRGDDIPSARPTARPDGRALGGGLLLFGIGYGAALVMLSGSDSPQASWLAVPIAGPWVKLGLDAERPWAEVADGITQLGGALLVTGALVYPRRVLGTPTGAREPAPHLALVVAPKALGIRGDF